MEPVNLDSDTSKRSTQLPDDGKNNKGAKVDSDSKTDNFSPSEKQKNLTNELPCRKKMADVNYNEIETEVSTLDDAVQMELSRKILYDIYTSQTKTYRDKVLMDLNYRKAILQKFQKAVELNERLLTKALHSDLHRNDEVTFLVDLMPFKIEIKFLIDNLFRLAKPKRERTTYLQMTSKPYVKPEPLGPSLVIAPFNYPINLSLIPVAGALAAGCPVCLKLSSSTPAVIEAIRRVFKDSGIPSSILALIEPKKADLEYVTGTLQWGKIFFTGSTDTARMINLSCAKNLTPVTYELGGCNPFCICESANLKMALDYLALAKFMNAGQTCISPQYAIIIGDQDRYKQVVSEFADRVSRLYYNTGDDNCKIIATKNGKKNSNNKDKSNIGVLLNSETEIAGDTNLIETSEDTVISFKPKQGTCAGCLNNNGEITINTSYKHMCTIITESQARKHAEILTDLLSSNSKINCILPGESSLRNNTRLITEFYQPKIKFIPPTILINVPRNTRALREEIFGPIIMMLRADSIQDAVSIIEGNKSSFHAKPLAAYIFTKNSVEEKYFVDNVSAGAVSSNMALMHVLSNLNFGGVGESGMGSYHHEQTFIEFSHMKPILLQKSTGCLSAFIHKIVAKTVLPPYEAPISKKMITCFTGTRCVRLWEVFVIISAIVILFVIIFLPFVVEYPRIN